MMVGKRILAALTLLVAAAVLLVSLAVAVGVWVVKGTVTERATDTFGRVDAALDVAEQNLAQARASLDRAAERLDGARQEQRKLAQEAKKGPGLGRMLARTVQRTVAPEVGNAHEKLHTVAEAAVVVNSVLEDLGNFPLLAASGMDLAALNDMNGRLADVGPAAWELGRLLGEPGQDADAEEQMSRVQRGLQAMQGLVARYEPQVTEVRQRTTDLKAQTLAWITPVAVAVTLIFTWIALSQVSVIAHALSWWRRAGQGSP
jgi:hypothetical protein